MRAEGYIEYMDGAEATVMLFYGSDKDGYATLPLTMFPEGERGSLRDGTIVEAEIDETLLVTSIKMADVGVWTEEDIERAKEAGRKRAAELKWT